MEFLWGNGLLGIEHENDPDGLCYVARVIGVICNERQKRQWSGLRLAQESGVHHSVIVRAENGERIPGVPVLVRLCRALDLRFSEVCRIAEQTAPEVK